MIHLIQMFCLHEMHHWLPAYQDPLCSLIEQLEPRVTIKSQMRYIPKNLQGWPSLYFLFLSTWEIWTSISEYASCGKSTEKNVSWLNAWECKCWGIVVASFRNIKEPRNGWAIIIIPIRTFSQNDCPYYFSYSVYIGSRSFYLAKICVQRKPWSF